MTSDPIRLGLPSASSFAADVLCPGRRQLIAKLPKVEEEPDEESARGSRIHAAWETGNTLPLSEDELADYTASIKYADGVIATWCQDNSLDHFEELPRECRYWLHHPATLDPMLSGQLDRQWRSGKHALILDLKSGWSTYVPPSNQSWQLRAQALLLWKNLDGIEKIRVGFVKPKLRADPTDYTDYTLSDLQFSEQAIMYHLWALSQEGAPRHAGIHCRYCAGQSYCPESGAMALLPSVLANPITAVETLAPTDLARIWEASTVVTKILDAVKKRLKAMPDEDLVALGITRGKPKNLDPIVNVKEAFGIIKAMGVAEDRIWTTLGMSKTELVMLLRREVGMTPEGAAAWIKESLASCIESKTSEASLVKVK